MCELYRMTSTFKAMRRLFAVESAAIDVPAYPEIYPNREGQFIRTGRPASASSTGRYGASPPPSPVPGP